uniref:enolase C-terminal domain-like protein n=1 Tax=Pelagibius sp. TaxID=1931238 RepID=UPI0026094976
MDKLPPFTVARVETFPLHAKVPGSPQMSLGEMAGRPALLVRIEDGDGAYGWGEVWANFPPRAHFHKADLIEDVIAPRILGQDFDHPGALAAACDRALSRYALHVGQPLVFEHCYAGLDTAAWDLALRKAGRSAAEHFGFAEGARVYASSLNEDAFSATAADWLGRGVGGCKIKVGYDRARDLAFIRRARDELPQSVDLMIDANQAWEVEEALEVASAVA